MINPIEAKKFAEKVLKQKLPKLLAEYYITHSKFVIIATKNLAKEKNLNVNPEILEISGYLHDTGYSIKEEGHAEESLKITENKFSNINKTIIDCILNHGPDKKPLTEEGKIFQLADKLAAFYPKFIIKLIELEEKEGKLSKKEIIEKQKRKMEKYFLLFEDKDFKKLAKKYFKEFLKKYYT